MLILCFPPHLINRDVTVTEPKDDGLCHAIPHNYKYLVGAL